MLLKDTEEFIKLNKHFPNQQECLQLTQIRLKSLINVMLNQVEQYIKKINSCPTSRLKQKLWKTELTLEK